MNTQDTASILSQLDMATRFIDGPTKPGTTDMHRWEVTLTHKPSGRSFTTSCSTGSAHRMDRNGKQLSYHQAHNEMAWKQSRPIPPSLPVVFSSLVFNAMAGLETFDEFCDSMGYDQDSRKAEAIHKACRDIYFQLRALGFDPEQRRQTHASTHKLLERSDP